MKKVVLYSLLICTIIFSNCGSDDDKNTIELPPQYPMKTLIENGVLDLNSSDNSPNTFEMGYKFKSFKNGKITGLSVRLPGSESYRVSLWNVETETLLITKEIQATNGLISLESISPISITSGVDYFVAVNTNDFYRFGKGGATIFPAETEDILVTGYGSSLGTSQVIPTNFSTTAYLGMVDIEFVPNN